MDILVPFPDFIMIRAVIKECDLKKNGLALKHYNIINIKVCAVMWVSNRVLNLCAVMWVIKQLGAKPLLSQ